MPSRILCMTCIVVVGILSLCAGACGTQHDFSGRWINPERNFDIAIVQSGEHEWKVTMDPYGTVGPEVARESDGVLTLGSLEFRRVGDELEMTSRDPADNGAGPVYLRKAVASAPSAT